MPLLGLVSVHVFSSSKVRALVVSSVIVETYSVRETARVTARFVVCKLRSLNSRTSCSSKALIVPLTKVSPLKRPGRSVIGHKPIHCIHSLLRHIRILSRYQVPVTVVVILIPLWWVIQISVLVVLIQKVHHSS